MLFLWFYHACRRGSPRFMMVADHINYLTFEDPAAVHVVRRALKLAQAGDLYGAAETAGVELGHASVVSEGLRKGMRYSIGAEVDNDPRSRPDAQNIVDAMKPDGVIRSVHFLPITHPQHGENWMWAFDNPEFVEYFELVGTERVWEIYMETLLDAIDKLPGHIVGHFYVPAKFGHWPDDATLESYEDRLIDACAERGMAVEVNSRYLYKYYVGDDAQLEKFRTAHLRLMRKAKAKGVMVAVGSDAHSPRDQGGAFEAVLALLDEADINEIAFPLNDRLARVALRATEEILRQHSAALAERSAPARPRVGLTPDPPEDDDALDDDSERTVEPRIESANPDAEIILPPAPEPEPEPEEPAVAAAPKVKAPPKPRKSRAKAPAVAAAVASDAPATEATPAAEVVAASEPQPELAAVVAPVPEATPVPAKTVAPKRATAKPKSAPVPKTEPEPAPVVATPKAAAKPAPAPKAAAKPPAAKAPIAKAAVPKAAASKAAPVKKVEPIAKKAPPAKAAPKKAAPPVKKVAPVKKAASKKVAPAKKAAAKAPPAKAAAKKAVKKKAAPAKKSPAKKTVAKKSAKPAAKKTARTSATSAKRPAAKRPSPKKPAAKKAAKKKTARR
jgi:HisJ family histidinol phosphate phosphatase